LNCVTEFYANLRPFWSFLEKMDDHLSPSPSADELARLRQRITELECEQIKQAEALEKLRLHEATYRNLVEHANEGMAILQDGVVKFANRPLARMWGGTVGEIINTPFAQYIHPEERESLVRLYEERLSAQSAESIDETRLLRKDGSPVWVELKASLIKHNRQRAALVTVRDITARKQIEKALGLSEETFRNIITALPMGIHIYQLDDHGRLIFIGANPAADTLLGLDHSQLIGKPIEEAFPPLKDTEIPQHYRLAAEKGTNWTSQQVLYPHHQAERIYEVYAFQMTSGKMAALFNDITEREKAVQALRDSEEAERKQRQLAESLRSALEAGASLSSSLDFEVVIDQLLENLEKIISFDGGSILLVDPQKQVVQTTRIRGYAKNDPETRQRISTLSLPLASAANLRWMCEHKQPLIINDTCQDPDWIPLAETEYLRSWIGAPIVIKGEVAAFFSLQKEEPNYYTQQHILLLQAFAGQAALALQNALLFEEIRQRAEETTTLLSASMSLSSLNPQNILKTIGEHARSIFSADGCRIFLLQPDGETLRCELAVQENEAAFAGLTIRIGQGVTGTVAATGEAEIVNDMSCDPRAIPVPGTEEEAEAIMFAPLKHRMETIGVISVRRVGIERPFKTRDLELLKAFASLAASAVINARLYEETRRRAELLSALHIISQKLSTLFDLQTIGEVILPEIENLLGWKYGSIWLVEGENRVRLLNHSTTGLEGQERDKELKRLRYLIPGPGVGIIGRVIKEGQPVRVGNVHMDPGYVEGRPDIHSELCVPLKIGQQTIGCINFESETENAFSEEDEQVLTTLAGEIAIAIQRALLFERSQRQAEDFSMLYQVTGDLGSVATLGHLAQEIARRAASLMNVSEAGVYLYEKQNEELQLAALFSASPGNQQQVQKIDQLVAQVAKTHQPQLIEIDQKSVEQDAVLVSPPIQAIAVPMLHNNELWGVITVFHTQDDAHGQKHPFTQKDVQLLSFFATSAGSAVYQNHILEETRQRVKELEILQALSADLRQTRLIAEMLPIFIKYSAQAVGAKGGSIYLREESTNEWVAQGWINADGKWAPNSGNLRHLAQEGVTGFVGTSGEIYITENWRTDPITVVHPAERPFLADLTSAISLPLKTEEAIIGVMHLWFPDVHSFTESEKRLLTAIADIAGSAIQRGRLYEEIQKRLRHITALHQIDTAINASVDMQVTIKIILSHTARELGVDAVAVALLRSQARMLEYVASQGFRTRMIDGMRLPPGNDLAWQAILQRQIVSITKIEQTDFPDIFREENFVSQFAVPLVAKGQVQGVLQVFHRSPLQPPPDWFNFLNTLAGQAAIAIDNATLYENLQRSNLELSLAYDDTIEGWSRALDLRDRETEGHTQRVTEMTLALARAVGISEEQLVHIRRGALLHDIGKMAIPDHILFKQSSLTPEEQEIMHQHPVLAYNMLASIEYLRPAIDIPYCHHERWDGSGYPRGLKGENIPLAARLFAVVDVYDALTSDRPYRKAWSQREAVEYLLQHAGTQFDPQAVQAFIKLLSNLPPHLTSTSG